MKIIGAGGKSGGGGGGISEDPDTLSSNAYARIIDLIGEGEIEGLVNNEYSIYLDGVPLKNLDGTPNYKPFRWDFRAGLQSQPTMPGFASALQEVSVGLKIQATLGRVVRSVADAGADAARVTLAVNGLSQTTSDGRVIGAEVKYRISARIAGGSWVTIRETSISGKTRSRYQRSHEINLAKLGAGPYEIGVERLTEDSASALLVNDLFWDSYTVINYEKFTYPNSVIAGLMLDARYFNQVPTRAYHVRGLIVRVPTNYDPVTRKYATSGAGTTMGAWDGTFKWAYTNNPAWCYLDLLINPRYGLGRRITLDQVNKWEIYTIARYCDELVPTGNTFNVLESSSQSSFNVSGKANSGVPVNKSNYEPRFTLNCVLNTPNDAYKVLNNLTSVFRGMAYWASGSVMLTQDRPTNPTMIWTNANVIDGKFFYEGSSRSERYTTVTVGWNDPAENFKQKFEYVEDREGISRYGVRGTDMVAFGCTSKSQARRAGLWLLYTQRLQDNIVKFIAGFDSANVKPGTVGVLMDGKRAGVRYGGRILSGTTTSVTLDSALSLSAGTYTISIMTPTSKQDRTITIASGTVNSATFALGSALPSAPTPGSIWVLSSVAVQPRQVRVLSIRQIEDNKFEITALREERSKFQAIDFGARYQEGNYSLLSVDTLPTITGLVASEVSYKTSTRSLVQSDIEISWNTVNDLMVRDYMVKVVGPDGAPLPIEYTRDPYISYRGVSPGTFRIEVRCVNHLGNIGPVTTLTATVTGVDTRPPPDVSAATFSYRIEPTIGVRLLWSEVADYVDVYEIRRGTLWSSAAVVAQVKGNSHPVGLVQGSDTYLIKAIDTAGNYSANAAAVVVNVPVPGQPSLSYSLNDENEILSWTTPASEIAIARYEVRFGATFGGSVFVDSVNANSLSRKVLFGGSRTYWVVAYNAAGAMGVPASIEVNISEPGPVTSARAEVVDNNVLLYWSKPSTGSLPVARYEVRKGATWASGTTVGSNADSTFATVFEQASGDYTYWITAYDSANNPGTPVGVAAKVSQPPDYVLRSDINSAFAGSKTNMHVEGGKLVGPVNTTETWAQHFTNNGWSSPQDQVSASYPIYMNPSLASGSYQEDFDFGAVIPASTVSASIATTAVSGSVTVACQIYYKKLAGDPWTAASAGATSVFVLDFRYIRVVWTFTCSIGNNVIRVDSFNLKIAAKLKTDSGAFTITDANAGVFVPFNVVFIDADTPVCQANGSTALIPIVDFSDVPNPTGFTVYLHNPSSGVKVTGSGSWTARGY